MPAILLRMAAINAIELNAQFQPPDRQMRQVAGAGRRKRRACSSSVRMARGKRCSRNARSNHGRTPRSLGATMQQTQDEPTARVGDCQRIAARLIGGPEPTFEIRRPDIIRGLRRRQRLRQRHDVARAPSRLTDPLPAQQIPHRARGRPCDVAAAAPPRWRAASSAPNGDARPAASESRPEPGRPSRVRAPSAPATDPPAPPPDPHRKRSTHL